MTKEVAIIEFVFKPLENEGTEVRMNSRRLNKKRRLWNKRDTVNFLKGQDHQSIKTSFIFREIYSETSCGKSNYCNRHCISVALVQ